MITLTGYLRQVSDGSYYMDCEDGVHVVAYKLGVEPNVPVNRLIALSVDGQEKRLRVRLWHWQQICDEPNYTLIQQAEADPLPRKHILLARFVSTTLTDEQMEESQNIVDDAALWLENYYRYYSGDRWDIKVLGIVIKYDGYNVPPLYARAQFDKYMAENELPEGFHANYFHGWGGKFNREVCGLADIGGNRSATKRYYGNCGYRTIAHEVGHNFGLPHAGVIEADGTIKEYGDTTSLMGSMQTNVEGHHSYHMVKLGWYEDREIKVINGTEAVLIAPIEMPYHGMRPNEYQHVILRQQYHDDVYVSLRKTKGTLYPQHPRTEDYLYLHNKDVNNKTQIMPSIMSGNKRTIGKCTLVHHVHADETSSVTFTFEGDTEPEPLPITEGFAKPMPSATVQPKHSGAWYNKSFDGQGLDIYLKDRDGKTEMVLYWYTYGDAGLPIYYIGHGFVEDGVCEFDLLITEGGTWDDPTTYRNVKVGRGQLYFLTDDFGVFNYHTEQYGRGGFEITPIVLTDNDMDGAWFDRTKNGSGFGLRFFNRTDDRVVGYWYNYDKLGKQVWYSLSGELVWNMGIGFTYKLTIREHLGGRWMYYDEPTKEIVGTAYLDLSDMVFDYEINASGVKDTGVLNLKSIF